MFITWCLVTVHRPARRGQKTDEQKGQLAKSGFETIGVNLQLVNKTLVIF